MHDLQPHRRNTAIDVAFAFSLALVLSLSIAACFVGRGGDTSSTPDTAVRVSLDVYREVIGPAYVLARRGCDESEQTAVRAERDGHATPKVTDALIAASRKRCDAVFEVFEVMLLAHDRAATALEGGELEQAQRELADLRGLWSRFREGDAGT